MQKVALTGNIGSGKSIISEIFSRLGIPVYNADENARRILFSDQVNSILLATFGQDVMDENGLPDRNKIAGIVFSDAVLLKKLNSIIHPLVMNDFVEWCGSYSEAPFVILESAIIYENGLEKYFDKVILVTAPEELRICRVMERDHVDRDKVMARINNQMPESLKSERADYIINNDENELVVPQVLKIYNQFLSLP